MTPSFRGWEAFPKPRNFTYTRITRAFSPMAPQVLGVTSGSPLSPWCCGHSSKRGVRHKKCQNLTILVFFDIHRKYRCQKPPQLSNLDNFYMSYRHLKVGDIFTLIPRQQTSLAQNYYRCKCILKVLGRYIHKGGNNTTCQLIRE